MSELSWITENHHISRMGCKPRDLNSITGHHQGLCQQLDLKVIGHFSKRSNETSKRRLHDHPSSKLASYRKWKITEIKNRYLQTFKYYLKMRSQINNLAFNFTVVLTQKLLFQNNRIPAPMTMRAEILLKQPSINRGHLKLAFSYRILNISWSTWIDWTAKNRYWFVCCE